MSGRGTTLQRLERILVMVPWLLEQPGVPIEEVAERFGTTPKAVASDLDLLGYCGLPGYGGGDLVEVSIEGGLVTVRMAPFFRRPLRLTLPEAVALLLAARTLAGVADSAALGTAIGKLADVLGVDPQVAVDLSAPGDEHLGALRAAVEEGRVVRLVYRSGTTGETTTREVEPRALVGADGVWYLQGECRLAEGARDFRLDRIRELTVLDERVETPPRAPRAPRYEPGPADTEVVLEVGPSGRWFVDWVVADDVRRTKTGWRVRFRTPALEWVAGTVLRLEATVVTPAELGERVRDLAAAALARYEEPRR